MDTSAASHRATASSPQLQLQVQQVNRADDDDDDDIDDGNIYTGDDDNEQPWKTLLDMPGRATWRVANQEQHDASSAALRQAQNAVLENGKASWYTTTSNKQLLKTLVETSTIHHSLANRRERERLRAHRNERKGGGGGAAEQGADDPTKLVYYGPIETLASAKHRLYPNYAVARRVLRETKSLVGINQPLNPKRVLDFGMGCGSASAAALDVFAESIEWIHGIDASQTMREGSQRFLQEFIQLYHSSTTTSTANDSSVPDGGSGAESMATMDRRPPPRITHAAHLTSSSSSSSGSISSSGRYFDLCLFCYTALEIPHNASTLAAAALLWEKLNPNGGILVMIEPGTPDGFSSIRQVRNMLLDCCPPKSSRAHQPQDRKDDKHGKDDDDDDDVDDDNDDDENETLEECHILAPCTHNRACPMERSIFSKPLGKRQSSNQTQDVIAEKGEDEAKNNDKGDHDDDSEGEGESNEHDGGEDEVDEVDRRKGYCSFVHSMPSAGGHNKSEKFSYLVAQKRTRGVSMISSEKNETQLTKDKDNNDDEPFGFENIRLSELLDQMLQKEWPTPMHHALNRQAASLGLKFLDSDQDDLGLEFVRGDANRSSFGRIIHAPKKKKAHVLIDTCSNGRIVRHKIPKSLSQRAPGIYAAARKSRWGGLWLGSKHTEDKNSYKKED
jgi:ribosomal protein RSM22 (predicted rRNA methylase)